jgi:hypothetical protein
VTVHAAVRTAASRGSPAVAVLLGSGSGGVRKLGYRLIVVPTYEVYIGDLSDDSGRLSPDAITPYVRTVAWRGEAADESTAIEAGWGAWDAKYGADRRPAHAHVNAARIGHWVLVNGSDEVHPVGDGRRFRYVVEREDGEQRDVFVELTGSAAASHPDTFPSPLDEALRTKGRSVIEGCAERVEPPAVVWIDTQRFVIQPREGYPKPGDRVYVLQDGEWVAGTVEDWGEPADAIEVEQPGVIGGVLRRDVLWVRRWTDSVVDRYRYEHVRATPPRT